jgi:hypothetical protein
MKTWIRRGLYTLATLLAAAAAAVVSGRQLAEL